MFRIFGKTATMFVVFGIFAIWFIMHFWYVTLPIIAIAIICYVLICKSNKKEKQTSNYNKSYDYFEEKNTPVVASPIHRTGAGFSLKTAEQAKNMISGINIEGTVERKGEPRTVNMKSGGTIQVCDAFLIDKTGGKIKLTLWGDEVEQVKDGDKVRIENGHKTSFKGEVSLTKGKYGRLEVISNFVGSGIEEKNTQPVIVPKNEKQQVISSKARGGLVGRKPELIEDEESGSKVRVYWGIPVYENMDGDYNYFQDGKKHSIPTTLPSTPEQKKKLLDLIAGDERFSEKLELPKKMWQVQNLMNMIDEIKNGVLSAEN